MPTRGLDTAQPASEDDRELSRAEEDELASLSVTDRINRLLTEELGSEMAEGFAHTRAAQERWARRRHPQEGLRERKKRQTRQQISDVATTLFVVRGFERVTVAQIAEIVGVSEKTVYNYFPTKESLVFDEADEGREQLARALRERDLSESPTKVILRELGQQSRDLEELPDESQMLLPLFAEMVATTPALRAAWLELQDRLATVVTAELARGAELGAHEPEPMIAARAIVGLIELSFQARIRHVENGLRGSELSHAITADLSRAARLLDTGLWSFSLLTHGARSRSQVREAAIATEQARTQVMDALKQARTAWRELRDRTKEEVKTQRVDAKRAARAGAATASTEAKRAAKAQIALARNEAGRAAKGQAAAIREEAKRAAKAQVAAATEEAVKAARVQIVDALSAGGRASVEHSPPTAAPAGDGGRAYEHFRRMMAGRHEAIRARQRGDGPSADAP